MTTPHQGQVAGTRWDPTQYLKFSDHRLRPALELLDRVPLESPNLAYDLGCGAGQIACLMAEMWPEAQVFGLDNSPDMLAQSAQEPSRVNWVEADTSESYYDLLVGRVATLDMWEVDYLHVLGGEDPVLEWVRSTGLRPILKGLEDSERDTFLAEYRSRLRGLSPVRPNGRTLYPFRRLFIVATSFS